MKTLKKEKKIKKNKKGTSQKYYMKTIIKIDSI